MLCTNACGCGIKSDSLIIDGSGQPGDPWKIDVYSYSVVTSLTRPASPVTNQSIYETDTKRYLTWNGSTWVMYAAGQIQGCQISSASPISVPYNTVKTLDYDTEDYDPYNWHVAGNPNRITPNIAGRFQLHMTFAYEGAADYTRVLVGPRLNGSDLDPLQRSDTAGGAVANGYNVTFSTGLVVVNGSGDYFDTYTYQLNGTSVARTIDPVVFVEWKGP